MPRAFLVKKPCVSTCKRNWSELPDEERGEIYVPGEAPGARACGGRRAGRGDAGFGGLGPVSPRRADPWARGGSAARAEGAGRVGVGVRVGAGPPAARGAGGARPRWRRRRSQAWGSGPPPLPRPAPLLMGGSGVCHRSSDPRLLRRKSRKRGLS
jgi:hypothetical protein